MEPTLRYPFNVRSFFTNHEYKDIGGGIELWRGFFQSIRPSPGRMLINVDISTGMMYRSGPLLNLCLEFLGGPNKPLILSPKHGLTTRIRMQLQRFISGIRVFTRSGAGGKVRSRTARVVKQLSEYGASQIRFVAKEGGEMSIPDYFRRKHNLTLLYPDILCVEVRIVSGCYHLSVSCL